MVIISSILAAIALPNYLRQTGKARESEFQTVLGSINRTQQAYHVEKQTFAQGSDGVETLGMLGISLDNRYIDDLTITGDPSSSTTTITNNEFSVDGTRAFSGGTYFDGTGLYSGIICRSFDIEASISPPTDSTTCPVDTDRLF